MANEGGGTRSTYTTPGVYIEEQNGFPASVVGVATAAPVFIGYTEFAGDPATGKPLYNQPVEIQSMGDYAVYFGGPPPRRYRIVPAPAGATPDFIADSTSPGPDGGWDIASAGYLLEPGDAGQFLLYRQLQLYFNNGGGACWVVAVGSYWTGQSPVSAPDPQGLTPGSVGAAALTAGLALAGNLTGPTMTVIPESCQLDQADYAAVATAMLAQAGALGDRMAILDLPGCLTASTIGALQACQANLWTALAPQAVNASYGAAYAPALNATVVPPSDVDFISVTSADNRLVNNLLTTQACQLLPAPSLPGIQAMIASAFPLPAPFAGQNTPQYSGDAAGYGPVRDPASWRTIVGTTLTQALPLLANLQLLALSSANVQPPSGAMAGIWARNDQAVGVWQAPANAAPVAVASPLLALSEAEQGDFNVPDNGMAIDIIRYFTGQGTLVWGARTLDGNSNDFRYIAVRRTLIYIEQSIKAALQQFVFAPNTAQTWATVTAMVSNFLDQLWRQGGLAGAKPADAYSISCGLGKTMTAQEILDGTMIVSVLVAITHPAEFIVLTISQQMAQT